MINPRQMTQQAALAAGTALFIAGSAFGQHWVNFVNETSTRLVAPSSTGANDPDEKDYAFADFDKDGDIDLVCVRKQPFTTAGKRVNVLFMNEGGVLTDRTQLYAVASDIPGDEGFLTPTNDRDVVAVDVNNDTWIDLVTAVTLTDNQAKHLSHPRVYINLGNDGGGNWQGFRYEDARIPQMHPTAGPRFCSVAAGDIDDDGDMDLYFGDYDSGGAQIFDFNNRVLKNDGNGFFSDQTNAVLTTFQMQESAFGAASFFEDMNRDGALDVVKQTALNPPQHVAVNYNNPSNKGAYNQYQIVDSLAPYFVTVGDLNNDNLPDMVVADDGADHFWLNNGPFGGSTVSFTNKNFSYQAGGDDGFGGDCYIADLNNDGWNDVLIADVDVDITGCSRRTHIFRNLGNAPNVTLQELQSGGAVASIPTSELTGTHNIAIFDINQDGYLDMVIGRCIGTRVWIQVPPAGAVFSYPGGIPGSLTPDQATVINVDITATGGTINPASAMFKYSIGGAADTTIAMSHLGGDSYQVTLPAVPCPQTASFQFLASLNGGGSFTDPPGQNGRYTALSADSIVSTSQDFEAATPDWTVTNDASLTAGAWQRAIPVGTVNAGVEAAPSDDASAAGDFAFVTQNGAVGGAAGAADVDGGPTTLTSPVIDLAGSDATISYARWFYCNQQGGAGADQMVTEISNNNGATWVTVGSTDGTNNGVGTPTEWETVTFVVSDFVTPTDQVRVRFVVSDNPNGSVTEGGLDNFTVDKVVCPGPSCPGDVNTSGTIDVDDLNAILSVFGQNVGMGHAADIANDDGIVDVDDLNVVLAAFGTSC